MTTNNFEDKSDKTFDSAEILVSNNQKNSSIHCYYYSCLQLLNHFLNKQCRYSEQEIRNFANDKESHNKVINLVKTKLDEKGINALSIFGDLNLLKKARVKADYGMAFVIDTETTRKKTVHFREQFKTLIDDF
ncbi:MAG TPA: hypothetical protein DD740_00335 [Chryseobacterium sp.]|nr:hypothetical protein [Chryseobacterium sp.]